MSRIYEALRRSTSPSLPVGDTLATVRSVPAPAPSSAPVPLQPGASIGEKTPDWILAVNTLRKHWRLSALFAAVVFATTIVVTYTTKATYEPSARIEVDPPGEQFSLEGASAGGSDAEYLETQAKNLKSDKLAIAVIRKLHLDQNPDIVGSLPDRERASLSTSTSFVQLAPAENEALGAFRGRLNIQRDTASRLITVGFASHDPKLAALVTNTIVTTFIDQTYQQQHDAIVRSTDWLSRQLDDIKSRMEESNHVLTEYEKSIGVADIDANKSTFTERMGELSRQLTLAEADRIQLQALLTSVQKGNPDSLPEVRNSPVVQQLTERLAQKREELSQTMVVYGKNHPTVKKLQSEVDELQSQLDNQKTAILASVRSNYAAAHAREQLMNSEIKGTANDLNQMARYNALKKEAQANSELYNMLYAKVKEAGIAAASRSSNLRIVDEARVLTSPTRPNRTLNLGVGALLALLGAIFVAFLRDQVDTRIFTPNDVRDWVGSSNISIVPMFFEASNGQLPAPGNSGNGVMLAKGKTSGGVHFLIDRPFSAEAEALRSLYTSIMLSRASRPPQVVLVVSSFPGEGKTTVAANLAVAMAPHGSTCIVDADLRRGRIAGAFGVTAKLGLSDVLSGTVPLEQALIEVPQVPNLSVLAAHPGRVNAGELLCSEVVGEVIHKLRERFRFVVVDSAPLLPFADGRALSTRVDGLVFVGRSGITTREVVRRSLELLREVHSAPVLEFVLNAADLNSPQYRYYRYGYEYYEAATK